VIVRRPEEIHHTGTRRGQAQSASEILGGELTERTKSLANVNAFDSFHTFVWTGPEVQKQ